MEGLAGKVLRRLVVDNYMYDPHCALALQKRVLEAAGKAKGRTLRDDYTPRIRNSVYQDL